MKTILFDIETTPLLSYTWGTYDQNVIAVKDDWQLLSFSYTALGETGIHFFSRQDQKNDKDLTKKLWKVLNSADIVVAHNGNAFDIKKANAKFLEHGLQLPSPYVAVDTLRIARSKFRFTSNRLNDLAQLLKVGKKVPTPGIALWLGCMQNDPASWRLMERYNRQDVRLLRAVYLKLRPWAKNPVTVGVCCVACGNPNLQKRGFHYTRTGRYQILHCRRCGKYMRDSKMLGKLLSPGLVGL
jgi:uncharacterized protein YprB with RNaseH-like and TPR domain